MADPRRITVEVGERTLGLSNLDKILYPEVGFTKAQVIDYYTRIAPTILPHLEGRGITLKRFPDGPEGNSFFEKRCPSHRPDWMATHLGPGDRRGGIHYCGFTETASLVWAANLAALELHAPMARAVDLDRPTMVVFDLDPGEPATIVECCRVALELRDVLDHLGLEAFAKTSGSKGLQVYLPVNGPATHEQASAFALAIGRLLAKQAPDRVLVEMTKALRPGKVFVDWSQNSHHKTTIAPYSLRAKATPTCSTPVTWDEVADGADGEPLSFVTADVLDRVARLGDPFAPTLSLVQALPGA